ncbi:MAG: SulP family inorganic anion transporter [Planctomycetota bacterium]|nr:SulP family inorganic anion transporter [Planctomycetota bacterium]
MANPSIPPAEDSEPLGSFAQNLRFDAISGVLVFLIALPLCLGIANASQFPAINGVFTAVFGGIICSFISNSQMTIKGPAAGMIAIVLGAVTDFAMAAGISKESLNNTDPSVYLNYLPVVGAIGVVAGVIQILFGLCRAGALADLFPSSVIHGLLASIGLIIIGKQLYLLLGLKPNGSTEAYEAYLDLPIHAPHFAWQVALIGGVSLLILFLYPMLKKRFAICKAIPPQLIILVLAIPAAMVLYQAFDGPARSRSYEIFHQGHEVTEKVKSLLVKVPESPAALVNSFIYPDFSRMNTLLFWKWVLMFTLVGSLESLLSAKAVDVLDPWKRKTDLNRDMIAIGIANATVACIGGLPMISEIVRSSANKDYGARTSSSNAFHGVFLLISILVLPFLLNNIPLTALAAMLIYAGCRLAHYKEFLHMWHVGKEQLLIFISTIIGVLATDLLIGVGIGIAVKFIVQMYYGVKPGDFLRLPLEMSQQGKTKTISVLGPAIFTNWLKLKREISNAPRDSDVVVDCTNTKYLDHTVMSRLHDMERDFKHDGRSLKLNGLENHRKLSHSPLAARLHV